jgi:Ca2+/H+ antiporter
MSRAGSLDGLLTGGAARASSQPQPAWVRFLTETRSAIKATLSSDYSNYLLIVVPIAILGGPLGWNQAVIFILNFLAIFPLAALLSYSTEELSASVGQIVGGLLNATFGNAVEMIVSRLHIYCVTMPRADLHP